MALSFEVKLLRETSTSISTSEDESSGRRTFSTTISEKYLVIAHGVSQPDDVSDIQAACATDSVTSLAVPTPNFTTWYSATAGVTIPQAVCRSVSATRRSENGFVFDVEVEYQTPELTGPPCAINPPAAVTGITPSVTSAIGRYDRVMYADKNGEQCWKLPGTETPFSAPITETIPTFNLKIVQYEASMTFEQQIERSFKLNSSTYRTKDAGLWMIGEVAAVEESVQLASGRTTVVKVTYPISLSERFYYPPGVTATDANKVVYGWDKVQPLVDTMKISTESNAGPVPPRLVPMQDEDGGAVRTGYIEAGPAPAAGTERPVSTADDDRPDYLRFRTQDTIDFSTFLQA